MTTNPSAIDRRVAVVTGGSQGIGAALVAAYRANGWSVVATSRTIAPGTDPRIAIVQGDIGDPATARTVIDVALERFGRVDTLINNAGVFIGKPFVDYTPSDYDTMISVNLTGFLTMTQAALPHMLTQGSGHIVQMSTSLVDNPDRANPSALASLVKGGLAAATRSLAVELADRGVRVNAVAPGVINTPMHDGADPAELADLHPMRTVGTVQDVVDAVLYLETARFVTGEIMHVDGGMSAGH